MSVEIEMTQHEYTVTWTVPATCMPSFVTPEWCERREAERVDTHPTQRKLLWEAPV